MAMKDKLHTGELYLPGDEEIMIDQLKRLDRLYDFNQTRPREMDKRQALMKEMFAEIGEGCYIEPPFHSNMGAGHVHFGKNVYCNFGCTFVDDTHIYVPFAGFPVPSVRKRGRRNASPTENGSPPQGANSRLFCIYLAYSTALVSRITLILI